MRVFSNTTLDEMIDAVSGLSPEVAEAMRERVGVLIERADGYDALEAKVHEFGGPRELAAQVEQLEARVGKGEPSTTVLYVRLGPDGQVDWAEDCVAPEPSELLAGLDDADGYTIAALVRHP